MRKIGRSLVMHEALPALPYSLPQELVVPRQCKGLKLG